MPGVMHAALFCVSATLLSALLRAIKPEYSVFSGIAGALGVLLLALPLVSQISDSLKGIYLPGEMSDTAAQCVSAAAVVLVCEIAASLSREAGQAAIASQIELWGRIAICALCAPVFVQLLDALGSLSFAP